MVKIDMEIPKNCDVCDFYEDTTCTDYYTVHNYCGFPRCGEIVEDYITSRHPNCPLIECETEEKLNGE